MGLAGPVVVAVVALLPAAGWGEIYTYRTSGGTRVFTNAPPAPAEPARLPPLPLIPSAPVLGLPPRGAFALSGPSTGTPRAYDALIRAIAARYDIEYALVKAIIKAESDFDRYAVSRAGARGLMQLMPATAAQHRVRNVFDPPDNIEGGVRHLRMLLDRYGGNEALAVAAYNAGHARVDAAGGIPPIAETREYLARVWRYRAAYLREGGARVLARR
jgi:soluble lytic murein transglycosylase-like protein